MNRIRACVVQHAQQYSLVRFCALLEEREHLQLVVSLSVGGVRSRCPYSGVWAYGYIKYIVVLLVLEVVYDSDKVESPLQVLMHPRIALYLTAMRLV